MPITIHHLIIIGVVELLAFIALILLYRRVIRRARLQASKIKNKDMTLSGMVLIFAALALASTSALISGSKSLVRSMKGTCLGQGALQV